jgi:uncharacterized protein (DUF2252 family)
MKQTVYDRIISFHVDKEQGAVEIKLKLMEQDPFSFFRGTCHLFYEDLLSTHPFPVSPLAWACGDLHLGNFGSYKGAQNLVYFDLNDFDEAILVPLLYELSRCITSIYVASKKAGFSKGKSEAYVEDFTEAYKAVLRSGKASYIERDTAKGVIKKLIKQVMKREDNALIKERSTKSRGGRTLKFGDKLLALEEPFRGEILQGFQDWRLKMGKKGQVVDVGFRLAGIGSVGTHRYLFLLKMGKSKYKLLDAKRAFASSLMRWTEVPQPNWTDQADRIISVETMMQQSTPSLLMNFEWKGEHYVVKEMQPTTDKINIDEVIKKSSQFSAYLKQLGLLVASAQLRSSGRKGAGIADEFMLFAGSTNWESPLRAWCKAYSQQVLRDFESFKETYNNKRRDGA